MRFRFRPSSPAVLLFVLAALALAYWGWYTVEARAAQRSLARRFRAVATERGPAPGAAARREAGSSGLVGRIEIPRLGLSAMVLEGVEEPQLRKGIGHVVGSAFPGEPGTVSLAAHRDTYFRGLGRLRRGDRIVLRTPDGVFPYQVDSLLIVPPTRGDLLYGGSSRQLMLVTCYPFHWIGPAPKRYLVRAHAAAEDSGSVGVAQRPD